MQVIFQETVLEKVSKGKSNYTIAHVTYTVNGANRTHKILSFVNPEVFKAVQDFKNGETLEVTITKNEAGYDQWASVVRANAASTPTPPATAAKGGVSQYETRDERLERQLHIVRQSCLGYAVASLTPGAKSSLDPEKVKELAQDYVDFVYGNDFEKEVAQANPVNQDVPY